MTNATLPDTQGELIAVRPEAPLARSFARVSMDRICRASPAAPRQIGRLTGLVRTVVPDPPPVEFKRLLERRRQAGVDRRDEVWEGVLHMAPAPHSRHARLQWQLALRLDLPARAAGLEPSSEFNLGDPDDYRIPDAGLHHEPPDGLYLSTAAVAIEILSPGDDTFQKLPFYAAHEVRELLIIDPDQHSVQWLGLGSDGEYHQLDGSGLIDLSASDLSTAIDWPG